MTFDAAGILKRLPMFRSLSAEALAEVAKRTVQRELPRNAPLFREGEPCRGLFVVLDGSIKVYRSTPDGREQILYIEVPMHTLAELPLLDGGPYPASARAAEDSLILFLPRDAFQALYRTNPEIADAVIQDMGRRLRRLVRLVDRVTLKDVPARVAAVLLEEAAAAGASREGGEFDLPVAQDELARGLATTRESVARALARFRREGLIDQQGPRIRLRDIARLQDIAGVPAAMIGAGDLMRTPPRPR